MEDPKCDNSANILAVVETNSNRRNPFRKIFMIATQKYLC